VYSHDPAGKRSRNDPFEGACVPATANVDPAEIAKFDALAERWWDPHGEFKPLHDLNPLRLDFIRTRALLRGAKVLDVGCGGGILSEALAAEGAEVTGIDLAETPLKIAELHALESNLTVRYRLQSVDEHAAAHAGQYDVVTCMEMLEHVPRPDAIVGELATLLRPGGQLFVSTLNRNLKSFLLAIVGAEYVLGLLPRGTHEYERFIRPSELVRWARAAGLTLVGFAGLAYDPFRREFRMSRDTGVNYLAHFVMPEAPARS
jgi:2-polyprenyl-6-hydroxyphenyl methylase/3-demethylubiquinone-9 3-methyltransferase